MSTMTHRTATKYSVPKSQNTRRPRILCIDDDADIHTTIELRMREYDVEINHAFYGMQGIVETANTQPDLILMDLAMPNGDGQYLLDCIKSQPAIADIPIIVLTGMRDPNLKARVLHRGAEVFLQKPVRFEELLREVSRFVDIRKRDSEGERQ